MPLSIDTVGASNIEFSKADLEFEVTDKDSSHNEVLVYAEYGQESDLSDGQRISSVNDTVVTSTGTGSHTVDDFSPNTSYYFRSKADAVDFSATSPVENAWQSQGFIRESNIYSNQTGMETTASSQTAMDAVSASQTAMDAVSASQTARDVIGFSGLAYDTIANSNMAIGKYAIGYTDESPADYADMDAVSASQTAMDAVVNSETSRTLVMLSDFNLDSVWTEEIASSEYWEVYSSYPLTKQNDGHEFEWTLENNGDGGRLLQVANIGDNSGSTEFTIYEITIDSDMASEFVIELSDNSESTRDIHIDQDGTEIYSGQTNDGEVAVSISSSGSSTITIYADLSSYHSGAEYYFDKMRLN